MRGNRVEGRFSVDSERESFISGTTNELVRTVGQYIDWYFYDAALTTVDSIYDVGDQAGGRVFDGPHRIPVVKAQLLQGISMQNNRGLYNTDVLRITINMDVIQQATPISGSSYPAVPGLANLPVNPDHYLRDRIVYRDEVFLPDRVSPLGLVKDRYSLVSIDCLQVNPEELVNDPQFNNLENYEPFSGTFVPDTIFASGFGGRGYGE